MATDAMNARLFALFGAALLAGVALGPAMAAAQVGTAGNDEVDGDDAFGLQVSAMVEEFQNSTNGTGIGHAVSTFVVANNPGNAPVFAGSPGGPNATDNGSQGPPAFVQSLVGNGDDANETEDNETVDDNASVDDRRGPPDHAGGPNAGNQTAADGNVTDDANQSAGPGNGQGPPGHAGGGDDDGEDEDNDRGGDRGNNGGNGQGPPDNAGPR